MRVVSLSISIILTKAASRLISGEWIDEDVQDPLSSMVNFLTEKRDRAMVQEWGVWLLKYDNDRAMKVLVVTHI